MTESFQTPDQIAGEAFRVETVEVVSAQILVGAPLLEHVVDDSQNRMGDGNAGALPAPSGRQAAEAGSQEAVFGVASRLSCQHQPAPQPPIPFGDTAAPSLARTLMVADAHPRAQMSVAGKDLPVHTHLRHDRL